MILFCSILGLQSRNVIRDGQEAHLSAPHPHTETTQKAHWVLKAAW